MSRHPRATEDTDGGFLKRWSRRKARPEDTGEPDAAAPETEPHVQDEAGGQEVRPQEDPPAGSGEPEEPVLTDADMPDLESISDSTDMSGFFSPGVSEQLRTQALRRLFRMSKFNVLDGLDDYNDDFRNFELLGDLVTSDMRHRMETEAQRRREAAEVGELEPQAEESVEDTTRAESEEQDIAAESRESDESQPSPDPDGETDTDNDAQSRNQT